MIIEISDQWLINLLGFHPDTPIKEAIEGYNQLYAPNEALVYTRIGEYVLREAEQK